MAKMIDVDGKIIKSKEKTTALNSYEEGAKVFRKFVRRPMKYKDSRVMLRVEMKGKFSGWKLKDELLKAFGMEPGNCIFMNDLNVLGYDNPDVQNDTWLVDGLAGGKAADWLDDENVTTGTVFEGIFVLKYEKVGGITDDSSGAKDAMIAELILEKGLSVVEQKKETEIPMESLDALLSLLSNRP